MRSRSDRIPGLYNIACRISGKYRERVNFKTQRRVGGRLDIFTVRVYTHYNIIIIKYIARFLLFYNNIVYLLFITNAESNDIISVYLYYFNVF